MLGGISAGLGALVGQPRAAGDQPDATSRPVQDTQPGEYVLPTVTVTDNTNTICYYPGGREVTCDWIYLDGWTDVRIT